jgi:predicted dehydrogenase
MTNKQYRAAVVGLTGIGARRPPIATGGLRRPMGRSHVSCYVEHPRTELVAVCDIRSEALDEFRETWPELSDVALYTDFAELLANEQPDLVSVVTGDHVHADLTVAAAESGARAIFCEKPIATTLADADRMIDACERHGVLLSVDHTRRWRPLFTTARRLVAGGELGAVRTMATEHYGPRAMLFRNGTHLVDGLTFFAGTEPRWVTALLERGFESFDIYRGDGGHDPASEPSASALIAFDGDIRATYTSYKTTFPATLLTVTCDHGRLELTNDHGVVRTSGADRRLSEVMIEPEHYVYTNQLAAIEELVTALDGGGNSLVCSGTDARWTLEILLGILASQQAGHNRVDLPLPRR